MFNLRNSQNVDEQILNGKYKIIKKIGSGSFGKVYMAEDITSNNTKVAIKQVSKSLLEGNEYLYQAFWKELNIMKLCKCENSVCLIEHFEYDDNYNIVMELCDTDLEVVLNKRVQGFSERELKVILTQLNLVFALMNKENVIHRDLKLKNILVKYDNKIPEIGFIAKLSDFGFSKVMDEDITMTKLGTPATMAPEILRGKPYNKKADLWSIGVISYQLIFKAIPFKASTERDLLNVILQSKGLKYSKQKVDSLSKALYHLLDQLLQVEPKDRISFEEYFNHPFFKGGQVESKDTSLNNNNINNEEQSKTKEEEKDEEQYSTMPFEERFCSIRKLSDTLNGSYSIFKAKDKVTNKFVYIREFLKKIINDNPKYLAIYDKEIALLKQLKGNNVFVKYINSYTTDTHYIIVTEHFQGKILDNFLTNHKSLSETFVQNIIRKLLPAFKILNEYNIVLDYISPKSFCFYHFNSEDDFSIKFFDYGLGGIFTPELERYEYFLNEGPLGFVSNQKTNILSLGLVVYRMLFGESIYTFTSKETVEETINKGKYILI
jgi:serine/threonine protein kinase